MPQIGSRSKKREFTNPEKGRYSRSAGDETLQNKFDADPEALQSGIDRLTGRK
jgi:hypothetical protein